ncbi:hypothetical protein [Calothrix sp. NIES-2098]|uniref:hypothetical protein n=1 Tax=Calothrix sp. NIES-2098 TaxID=1954171 RepID=UPI000B5E6B0E|nr:hypothetical protein NIES2098_20700 [Calothrix sp. NIES-2098]
MNYTNLKTAGDILNAFRECKNAGEEIDLFEGLATSDKPPVDAFVELLRSIKLESVLALTIQAFGKITNAEVKERLKQSDDLLVMLSEQAKSGASDLIRWSAATTIENIKFDFIAVSQHLTEEPKNIAERIMQSKIKRFVDQNLTQSNDYEEYLRFWIYGNYNKLRELTLHLDGGSIFHDWSTKLLIKLNKYEDINKFDVCWKVIESLALRGIQEIVNLLKRAEAMAENASELDENEVFENIGDIQSLTHSVSLYPVIKNLQLEIKFLGLQSNNSLMRFLCADSLIKKDNDSFLEKLREDNFILYVATITFSKSYNSVNYQYNTLLDLSKNLKYLSETLSRKKVKQDCREWLSKVVQEIHNREVEFQNRKNLSLNLKSKLESNFAKIRNINLDTYEKVILPCKVADFPHVDIQDEYQIILDKYDKLLRETTSSLRETVSSFYDIYKQNQLAPIILKISQYETENAKISISLIYCIVAGYIIIFLVAFLLLRGDIGMAILITLATFIFPIGMFVGAVIFRLFYPDPNYIDKKIDEAKKYQIRIADMIDKQKREIIEILQK